MRAALAILALLAFSPAAEAAWSDPVTVAEGVSAYNAQGVLADDGTPVVAWADNTGVRVRIGGGQVIQLEGSPAHDVRVIRAADQIAVAWRVAGELKVALGTVAGGIRAPQSLGEYELEAAAGNSAGEMSLLLRNGDDRFLSFKAVGAAFGDPAAAPEAIGGFLVVPKLALGATGETVVAWQNQAGVHVISRLRGGPLGPAVDLPGPSPCQTMATQSPLELALDGHGRALAVWTTLSCDGSLAFSTYGAAMRSADGTWKKFEGLPELTPVQLATGDAGQAVVTGRDNAGFVVIPVDLATGLVGQASRLEISVIYGRVPTAQDVHGTYANPELTLAPDGSASVVWGEDRNVYALFRKAAGSFGGVEVAGCQQLFRRGPYALGLAADGTSGVLFNAYPDGQLSVARRTPTGGPDRSCAPAEPTDPFPVWNPAVTYGADPVVAGKPVRVTVPDLRRPNAHLDRAEFYLDPTEQGPPVIADGNSAMLTFLYPGHIHWLVKTQQSYEVLGTLPWDFWPELDVFAPATLKARARQHRNLVMRVSAFTSGPRALVTIEARREGKSRAKVTGLLGLDSKRVRLKVKRPGRYRLVLLQGGVTRASTTVRVTR